MTEELFQAMGETKTIAETPWPSYDEAKTVDDEIELPVQFNGKLKTTVMISADADEATVKEVIHNNETVCGLLEGKTVVKEIYVKNKIYNIVVR